MTKLICKAFISAFITISCFVYADQLDNSYVLGFGSCITEKRDQPIWKAIEKENINEFFFMGDNVYGDSKDGLLKEMEISYLKQKDMFPEWLYTKKLNAIWDDHDYGKNDGGAEYPLKEQAQRLFLEFWNVDKDDARYGQKGIYFNEEKVILNNKINLSNSFVVVVGLKEQSNGFNDSLRCLLVNPPTGVIDNGLYIIKYQTQYDYGISRYNSFLVDRFCSKK